MQLLSFLNLLTCFAFTATALPWPSLPKSSLSRRSISNSSHTIAPSTLFEFPNPTWVENLAIRPNGQLLVTLISSPEMYLYDPIVRAPPTKLFTLPEYLSLLGIVELIPDVFYFVAGNFSTPDNATTEGIGTYAIFKIDLRFDSAPHAPTKVLDMPKATFLNGFTALSKQDGLLLVSDSGLGLVWKVDVFKREYEVFVDVPEMKIAENAAVQLGVNGIHVQKGFLYFTSFTQDLFCRVPITPSASGYDIGATETLATNIVGDDFILDRFGNAWITENPLDKLTLIVGDGTRKGKVVTVGEAVGGTAPTFGRTEQDKNILYVVTNGGLANPPASGVTGGKILAFDTTDYLASILG